MYLYAICSDSSSVIFTPVDNLVIPASLNAAVQNAVYRIYFSDMYVKVRAALFSHAFIKHHVLELQ